MDYAITFYISRLRAILQAILRSLLTDPWNTRQSNHAFSMSLSETYRALEDTFEYSTTAVKTTKETAKHIAQQVRKEEGDFHSLFKGPVCMLLYLGPELHWSPKRQCGMIRLKT